jgi:hypothetical protein
MKYIKYGITRLMNFLKSHKKIIKYLSVPITSIILFYFLVKISVLLIPSLKSATSLIFSIISTAYIFWGIPFLLRLLNLQPRDDWVKLLSSRGYKVRYYNLVLKTLKLWNISAPVLIITLLISMFVFYINSSINTSIPNPIIISENLLENPSFGPIISILIIIYMLLISIGFLGIAFFALIFPGNKVSGFPDASDMPISFLEEAIEEIGSFDFSLTWENKQLNKNRISNLMNDALEFITVRDKILGVPHGMRYYQAFIRGIKNKYSVRETLYRINGFSEKLNEFIVDLNYMNTVEDKEKISKSLLEYLIILKKRNLHNMERVEYPKIGILENIVKKIEPFKNITAIIAVIFALVESSKKIFGL